MSEESTTLRERCEALEALVRHYRELVERIPELDYTGMDVEAWEERRNALQQRAKELLGEDA